jgi:hypothetical protein
MRRVLSRLFVLDRVEALGVLLAALFVFLPSFAPLVIARAVTPEDLDSGRVHIGAPCTLRARGLPCRTCGMTRGFAALSRGRLDDARRYNARAPVAFFVCALTAALSGAAVVVAAALTLRRRP